MRIRLLLFVFAVFSLLSQGLGYRFLYANSKTYPFSVSLETLQKQIGYDFQNIGLLRRAMTHSSYSGENNRALSILGLNVIETSVSFLSLRQNIEISAKDLSRRITDVSEVDSCSIDALRLGLEKVVRVSGNTNSSTPAVVCGAFRALFGAIAVDSGKADDAMAVFWNVRGGFGEAFDL